MSTGASNPNDPKDDTNLEWLNAYNAPHWMNVYASLRLGYSTRHQETAYLKDGTSTRFEVYGTSWMRDVLKAWEQASFDQSAEGLWTEKLRINGLTDPTYGSRYKGAVQHNTGNHSIGMGIDLGVRDWISDENQQDSSTTVNPNIGSIPQDGWSLANAVAWSGKLPDDMGATPNNQQQALRDFLSLYALTRADSIAGNGTWDDIDDWMVNKEAHSYLFGRGTDAASALISSVLVGADAQNPYTQMHKVLSALGIKSQTAKGHYNHFHITLRAPERMGLPKNLTAAEQAQAESLDRLLVDEAQSLIEDIRFDFDPEQGDITMFTIDMPDPAYAHAPLIVAQAATPQTATQKVSRTIGVCHLASNAPDDQRLAGNVISPAQSVARYFREIGRTEFGNMVTTSRVTMLKGPTVGGLEDLGTTVIRHGQQIDTGIRGYRYLAMSNYEGTDSATFLVEIGGLKVKVVYRFVVANSGWGGTGRYDPFEDRQYCPNGRTWKISSLSDYSSFIAGQSVDFSSALSALSGLTLTTASLPNASLGQTTGTTVTLDDNAAGHGWYIDYTPYLNEEYLPTSNPNEWVAKEGSAASGKMDLLSVLLHEYGHALGIEHSTDPHDLMGTTLAPGVRRLPSAEELALMARLVGEIRADMETPTPGDPIDRKQPGAPLPSGGARSTRARLTRWGTLVVGESDFEKSDSPQYEIAANPTLADARLETGTGWETTGRVSIGNGAAILSESSTSQTRLNQVFIVGEHDRYLGFTVAGIELDNPLGPDDAFEAALLDANSGASLLAGTGLTRNDAFLNLQADGSERAVQGIATTRNADGSRTYRVDLAGIPDGTAVNLSFDLIGFGAATSHVTVRDIRLGVPETHDDSVATLEDTPIDIAATANDLDADQPGFVPVVVTGPAHREVVVNPDGSFRYTPAANWYGDDSFSYKLSDGSVDSNVATVSLSVAAVNDAPVVADVGAATSEDTPVTLDLLASASDIDSATLTPAIVVGPQHGALTLNADGSFTYTPEADWNGEDVLTYKVNDGELDSGIATVRIAVAAVNDAPVSRDFALATLEDTPLTFDLLAQSSDVDSTLLTPAIVVGPQHGTLTQNADGTWTYASDANYNGADSFTYRINDGALDSGIATVSLTVTPVNDAPVIAAPVIAARTLELDEDTPLTLDLLAGAGDVDGDALSVVVTQAPQHGVLAANPDGTWTYTPGADWNGTDSVEYQVSDGTANVPTSVTFVVKPVNDVPVVGQLALATLEDTALTFDLLAAASDVDSVVLTSSIVAGPQHGTLTQNANGSYTYTPESNYNGADSFMYRVNDGELDSGIATVSLTITPVNDAPVIAPRTLELDEDTPLTLDLLAGAGDVDGDALSVVITQAPLHGVLAANPDGTWTYTPDANWNGTDRVEYQVSDGTAGVPTSVTFVVRPINDAPVVSPLALATLEDTALTFDLLTAASDIDSTVLTPAIVTGPQHGTLTQNADGGYTYTPDANYHGTDSFAYQVNDGGLDSDIAIVSLAVTPVNDAPVIAPRTLEHDEDTPLTLDLLAGASDIDGDALSVAITQAPLHGALVANPDGTWTYTPDANWNGTDSVEYEVTDGTVSVPTSVTFVVKPINDAPVVGPLALATLEDTALTFDLLTAASDIDSTVLTPAIIAGPQHGTLTQNADGRYTYTPDANYHGADRFTYQVNDGDLDSTIATVSLTVTPVNDAPIASPIAATLLEDGSITLDLLAAASDIDGDPLTVGATDPQSGTLTHNPDGTWTYQPSANFNGQDGFSYTASDGQLTAESFVRLTITAVNDAPVAADDSAALIEDGSITLALLANDHDIDADPLSILIQSQPTHGAIVLNHDNTITYTPAENWSGEDRFTYRLSDGQALSETATVRLAVNPVADAPALVLTDLGGNSRELFRTGWESVSNRNATSTLVEKRELEGWTRVTRPDPSRGGDNGFEVWSSGDKMTDAKGKQRTVAAAAGDGKNWLELNDARGEGHQTLGIERTVDTVAGASYLWTLDYAGRIGYGADATRIGIYVDGQRIAGYANTSPAAALDWKALQFQFIGSGGQQTLRIVTEATQLDRNGRGAMIDDIALTETLPANTGFEDGTIRLSAVSAALTDTDGSETLKVEIQALPVGATLGDGTRNFTATPGNTAADVTGWNLGNLSIEPPRDFNGRIDLYVVATATESATGNQASTTAGLTVTVLAVNDAPQANVARFTVEKGGSIRIDFATLVGDVDGNTLALTLAKPDHGTLSQNADGTYTYTPRRGYTGIDGFSYTVSDGNLSATGRIAIDVVRDDHHHHHGNDHHHDNDHHRGDDDHGACIVVRSIDPKAAPVRIDWNGTADNDFMSLPVNQADWLPELLGIPQPDKRSLAEITGLVVRVKE